MPAGGGSVRGATQMKFGQEWIAGRPLPRPDLDTVPFVGSIAGETSGTDVKQRVEVRRRDIGQQQYGSGVPKQNCAYTDRNGLVDMKRRVQFETFDTSNGPLMLGSSARTDLGFMPTAAAVNFLRSEYVGSRLPDAPTRYYPK